MMLNYNDLLTLLFLQWPLSPSFIHLFSPLVLSIVQGLQEMNIDQRNCQVLNEYGITHKHLLGTIDVSLNSRYSPHSRINPLKVAFAKCPIGCADTRHRRSLEQSREPRLRAVEVREAFSAQTWASETHWPSTRENKRCYPRRGSRVSKVVPCRSVAWHAVGPPRKHAEWVNEEDSAAPYILRT